MIGLLLLGSIASWTAWLVWLCRVSPPSDLERIKTDLAESDLRILKIERIGTRDDRPDIIWGGSQTRPSGGLTWYRIYNVTLKRPNGLIKTCSRGVEARLYGVSNLRWIDWKL
jgi:hypothetical protein